MKKHYHAIYLSPHFDDAILSCGGRVSQLCRQKVSVLIVTLAAGAPPDRLSTLAKTLHHDWDKTASLSDRRQEDITACQQLGADWLHVPVPDALYRLNPQTQQPLYTSLEELFLTPSSVDDVAKRWTEVLRSLPAADAIFSPLGIGNHVDHRLVRQAAMSTFDHQVLYYYEDFPYCHRFGAVLRATWPRWHWKQTLFPLSSEDLEARIAAMQCYESQIDMLDGGQGRFGQKIKGYVKRIGGERVWQQRISISTTKG